MGLKNKRKKMRRRIRKKVESREMTQAKADVELEEVNKIEHFTFKDLVSLPLGVFVLATHVPGQVTWVTGQLVIVLPTMPAAAISLTVKQYIM